MVSAYSNNLNSVWPPKDANYFLVSFVERLTISYQVCSVSTTSIGHQTKDVVSDCIDVFDRTTSTEITAICCATKKTCMLDPLPAHQLTDNITGIVPAITRITNASLDEGVMPKSLKHAIVRPLLKKPSLDKDTLSSYRPVSNLTQLSKVIEKVVALWIMSHVSDQQMLECFQSAYRKKPFDRNCTAVCYKCRQKSNGQNTRNNLASR